MYPTWMYLVLLLILVMVRGLWSLFPPSQPVLCIFNTNLLVQNIPLFVMSFPFLKSIIPGAGMLFRTEDNGKDTENGSWTRVVAHFCFAGVWFALGAWILLGPRARESSKESEDGADGNGSGKTG